MGEKDFAEQQAAGSGIAQATGGGIAVVTNVHSPQRHDPQRQRLLRNVRSFWITGVLEQSLHGVALLELGLQEQCEEVSSPWGEVVQEWGHLPHQLSSQKPLLHIYDEVGGEVLLLGEPGCGKTTLLLELARGLLERARQDEGYPLPVVFNLSSWAIKCLPLREWLIEELYNKYQVSPKLGREWVASNQILPLLDGLDEVIMEQRGACIQAINAAHHEGLMPVVCCRRTDYDAAVSQFQESLMLQCALVIQPLTRQQIDDYLMSGGEQLQGLRKALQDDPELQEMVTTPLMLSILTLAYAGRSVDDLVVLHAPQTMREQIFATYVERMLHRRRAETLYSPEKTSHWLSWLAQQLMQKSQTIFHLERMQPTWLVNGRERFLYNALVRVSLVLLVCLAGWLISVWHSVFFDFLTGLFDSGIERGVRHIRGTFSGGVLTSGLQFGILSGLIYGLMSRVETRIQPAEIISWSWKNIWQNLRGCRAWRIGPGFALPGMLLSTQAGLFGVQVIVGMVIGGLLFGLLGGLLFDILYSLMKTLPEARTREQLLNPPGQESHNRLATGLICGLVIGLLSGLMVGLLSCLLAGLNALTNGMVYWLGDVLLLGLRNGLVAGLLIGGLGGLVLGRMSQGGVRLRFTRVFVWAWCQTWRHLRENEALAKVLIVGLILGLLSSLRALRNHNFDTALWLGLHDGLLGGLMFGLFSVLVSGLSSKMVEEQALVRPNQGIRRSACNSLVVGLVFGLLGWLIFGFMQFIVYQHTHGWVFAISLFLSYGMAVGLLTAFLIGLPNGGLACIEHTILRLMLRWCKAIPRRYAHFLDYAAERVLLRKVGGGYIFIHRLLLEHFAALAPIRPAPISVPSLCTCGYYDDRSETLLCPQCGQPQEQTRTAGIGQRSLGAGKLQISRESRWHRWIVQLHPLNVTCIGLVISVLIVSWHVWENTLPTYPVPRWQKVLDTSFDHPDNIVWIQDPRQDGRCIIRDRAYHIETHHTARHCTIQNRTFRDLIMEVQMEMPNGGDCSTVGVQRHCGGLMFHFNPKSGRFYLFRIEGKKESEFLPSYMLEIYKDGKYVKQLVSSPSTLISPDPHQWNVIAVVARGNSFELYVNKRHVTTITDPDNTSPEGQVGLMVTNQAHRPMEIVYQHVTLWTPGP